MAVLLAVLPPVLCGPAVASSSATEGEPREWLRGIDGMRRLPVTGLQMVRSGERTLFVSENGRFVFTGPAYDLWNRPRLASLEDAERASSRIDLSAMGIEGVPYLVAPDGRVGRGSLPDLAGWLEAGS